MAKAVSTKAPGSLCLRCWAMQRRRLPEPPPHHVRAEISALRARHSGLDPLLGGLVRRRVHALGRVTHDVDDFRHLLLLVVAIGAVGGVLNALMTAAEHHLHA